VVKGRTYEEVDLMRESRAEDDVIADIAAEELEAYLGSHLVTDNYTNMAPERYSVLLAIQKWRLFLSGLLT
jgi:hypothetical protein